MVRALESATVWGYASALGRGILKDVATAAEKEHELGVEMGKVRAVEKD